MGVAGSGKTTVGTALSARLDASFVDADSLHSTAETIMGRAESPVRDVVDAAFDRFLAPELPVLAPGVERFGEDPTIDTLIRRHEIGRAHV